MRIGTESVSWGSLTMNAEIKFNREICLAEDEHNMPFVHNGYDYIVPGGFEIVTDGKSICFDFQDLEWSRSSADESIIEYSGYNLDIDSFPEAQIMLENPSILENITEIREFFIYLGEESEGESIGLEPVKLNKMGFCYNDTEYVVDIDSIPYKLCTG